MDIVNKVVLRRNFKDNVRSWNSEEIYIDITSNYYFIRVLAYLVYAPGKFSPKTAIGIWWTI